MQIVDVTVVYTEEEKQAFADEFEARNKMDDAENELILLGKEWNNHIRGNHTDVYTPIALTVVSVLLYLVTIFFLTQGIFSFFALVTAAPAFATIALVVAIVFWVKYHKQNKAYKEKEAELDRKRDRLFKEYQKLKEDHNEKLKIVENIVYKKTLEKRETDEKMMNPEEFEKLFKKEQE